MDRPSRHRTLATACVLAAMAAAPTPVHAQDPAPAAPAFFLVPEAATAGATVAVGPDGTVHMAATSYGPADTVTYASCPSDCGEDTSWSRTKLPLPGAIRAEIAVTPRGAPRLLVIAADADSGGRAFVYGECTPGSFLRGGSCSDPARWTFARVAANYETGMGDFFELLLGQRVFALDPAGNPRFVFTDSNYLIEPDHYGAFYMSCDGGCTDPAAWTETDLANHLEYRTEQFTRPVLAIGPAGSAHLLTWVYGFEPDGSAVPNDVYYYECLARCADRANWSRVSLLNAGSGSYPSPTWDLAIDPHGHPRAAVFIAGGPTQEDLAYRLAYLWCDTACTSEDGWNGTVVLEESYGESPALALDAQGRPRIALLSPNALPVLATCNADCEAEAGDWDANFIESDGDMAADRPTAIPFTCDDELWNALMPDIAIAPDGRSYAAYDVSVQARCLYHDYLDPEPEITYEFHEIWRGARLAEVPQF